MAKPRLTPKNQRTLVEIANHWGHLFIPYALSDFSFLSTQDLIRRARPAEIDLHYREIADRLEAARVCLIAAAERAQYQKAKELAAEAATLATELADRAEEAPRLVALNERALDAVARIARRQQAAEVPQQEVSPQTN